MGRAVAFLDRDGVINERAAPHRYVTSLEQFRFVPGAKTLLKGLRELGYALVVITNQQGIGKGLMTDDDLRIIHDRMLVELKAEGIDLAGVFVCPHLESAGCSCRKPKPGLIHRAVAELPFAVDLARSVVIGDSPTDMEAGRAGNVRWLVLVDGKSGDGAHGAMHSVATVLDALALLQQRSAAQRAAEPTHPMAGNPPEGTQADGMPRPAAGPNGTGQA